MTTRSRPEKQLLVDRMELHELTDGDDFGNVVKGDVVAIETENCLVQADGVSTIKENLYEDRFDYALALQSAERARQTT